MTFRPLIVSIALASSSLLFAIGCSESTLFVAPSQQPVAQAYVAMENLEVEGGIEYLRYARIPFGSDVQLDGSQSFQPTINGSTTEGLTYAWSIYLTPEGSAVEVSDLSIARPTFTPDIAGTYQFELVVSDEEGTASTPSIATVIASPPEDLTISLNWTTGGTDVDVHLIRPGGAYWTDGDCYFGNPVPDWGIEGSAVDNPILNRDDDDGGDGSNPALEEVVLQRPEEGDFQVVVTYYNDRNNDLSVTPTLTISLAGTTVLYTAGPFTLSNEGDSWVAAEIHWPEMTVEPIDELTTHEALGGPDYNHGS